MLTWLNQIAPTIQALSAIATLWLTYQLIQTTKAYTAAAETMAKEEWQPRLHASLDKDHTSGGLTAWITNLGRTAVLVDSLIVFDPRDNKEAKHSLNETRTPGQKGAVNVLPFVNEKVGNRFSGGLRMRFRVFSSGKAYLTNWIDFELKTENWHVASLGCNVIPIILNPEKELATDKFPTVSPH